LFCAASFPKLTFRNWVKPREIQSCPLMSKRTIYLFILFSWKKEQELNYSYPAYYRKNCIMRFFTYDFFIKTTHLFLTLIP
jgi:hypothetical protein